jgi:tetratricopeptide (TPR) repeat protein
MKRSKDRLEKAAKEQPLSEQVLQREVSLGEKRVELFKRMAERKVISEALCQEAEKTLEIAKKNLKDAKQPQVWHRDRQRPSLARVYVGNGNALELVSLNVTVLIEGPRARTTVDHIFRNPHNRVLEGTFEYPLPTGASASYFAMFSGQARPAVPARFGVRNAQPLPADALARLTPAELVKQVSAEDWGTLQEARVVGKAKALETYEDIVRGNIDPALLEYSGGNTFSGRVFPIQPHGYNRVLIAYEEFLPHSQAGMQYRFPLPDCKLTELQFSLSADAAECREPSFEPAGVQKAEGAGRLTYSKTWKDQGPGGDVLFAFAPANSQVQAISGRQGESGPLFCCACVRPELPVETAKPFAEDAVFLLDTSLSEHPDRFDINMRLMHKVLENDAEIKRFNILTFDVAGRWVEPNGWLANTADGRNTAWNRLEGLVLEGATDLSAALDKLAHVELPANAPLNVFVLSDGQVTWGENDVGTLVARFESQCRQQLHFHCYRTGLGADNLELFEALTRRGGGIFNCYSEADLNAAALAHRHQCFQLERVSLRNGPETSDLLVAGRKAAIYPGGELIVAARADRPGKVELSLEGTFQGKRKTLKYPLEITGNGELAPRGWAEIAVASLLALNDPKLDDLVTAYCQQFGIGSRVASFLVLENPNDYKRLNLEAERGRTVPGGDLGLFLEQAWQNLGKIEGAKKAFEHFLEKIAVRVPLLAGPNANYVRSLLAALDDNDFALPQPQSGGTLLHRQDVPPEYVAARGLNRHDVAAYLTEARRRNNRNDVDGAVRVLSSVIEEHPGRADALRLVGYRLLALNQSGHAARLFRQVMTNRPFEPHSYRDMARSLEDCGKFGLAALQYEIVLAGAWHNRFRESLKGVSQEEYVSMMRQALQQRTVTGKLAELFAARLEQLASVKTQSDLRVTISWNTDATDVDLWVIEPDGTKCFYQHNRTKNGGELSQDETQGYGPERYQVAKALPGAYTIFVHYFRANPNLLAGETHVNVVVTRRAGTPEETSQRYTVILKKPNEEVEVCRVK